MLRSRLGIFDTISLNPFYHFKYDMVIFKLHFAAWFPFPSVNCQVSAHLCTLTLASSDITLPSCDSSSLFEE